MTLSVDLSVTNVAIFIGIYFGASYAYSYFKSWLNERKERRYDNIEKNVVILHCVPRAFRVPSASPYCLKLETFLRMAKIPYQLNTSDPFSVQGKTPWISFKENDGTVNHVSDSQFAVEFLNTKFPDKVPEIYEKADRGAARAIRILLETHFAWGYAQWRWIDGYHTIKKVTRLSYFERRLFGFVLPPAIKKGGWYHGIGRHSIDDIYRLTKDDLRSVSYFLGSKKFLLGDDPCEEDCAIFGMLAQIVWAFPESPYERLIDSELTNLRKYCERMKDKYWPDWNECLDKGPQ